MMLNEIYKRLEKSEHIYDFADAVVAVRLKMTHDLYLEEWHKLMGIEELTDAQQQDLAELTDDLKALKHVLGFYEVVH
jgi:uncharacterized protein YmfQ (DUF2313 family)